MTFQSLRGHNKAKGIIVLLLFFASHVATSNTEQFLFFNKNPCVVTAGERSYNFSGICTMQDGTKMYNVAFCNTQTNCASFECSSLVLQHAAVVELTEKEGCISLGMLETRTIATTSTGVELSFYNGSLCGESENKRIRSIITIECANEENAKVVFVKISEDGCSRRLFVRARAGCAIECTRDFAGNICGGAGTCLVDGLDGPAHCKCAPGYLYPHCKELPRFTLNSLLTLSFYKEQFMKGIILISFFIFLAFCKKSLVSYYPACKSTTNVVCSTVLMIICFLIFLNDDNNEIARHSLQVIETPKISATLKLMGKNDGCIRYNGLSQNLQDFVLVPAMWSTEYPSQQWHRKYQTCVYQRHDPSISAYVPNFGFEAGVYLRYIVDHYDSLPSIVAFIQEDATTEIESQMSCLRTDVDWKWTPLNTYFFRLRDLSVWRERGYGDAVHACWNRLAADFNIYLPVHADPVVSTYCCAYFAVTRDQIHKHSRASFAAAYERVVLADRCFTDSTWQGRNITNYGNDKDTSAGAFEHLQHAILGGQALQMEPFSQEDWCLRFLPDSECSGSPCKISAKKIL